MLSCGEGLTGVYNVIYSIITCNMLFSAKDLFRSINKIM